MSRSRTRIVRSAALIVALALQARPLGAQVAGGLPADLEGVGITERLDAPLPLEATFVDENGRTVTLGQFFEGGRPVLLSLVYYRCPMLCNVVQDGMVDALREIDLEPGRQFEIVTVSIDPGEPTELAHLKKQKLLAGYGRPETAAGWHFLTGQPAAIESLAAAVGFRYRRVPASAEYAHAAGLFVITPAGRVSRYLLGVQHAPRTVELALVEAGQGKIGSIGDQFLLTCYRYDSRSGSYVPAAWRIMRLGGVLTVLILASVLVVLFRRELREKRWA